jgi:hypothetical protein
MANTYWVEFRWTYKTMLDGKWEDYDDFEACRFQCHKRSIKKEVEKYVCESLVGECYKDLKVIITNFYMTTDCEI